MWACFALSELGFDLLKPLWAAARVEIDVSKPDGPPWKSLDINRLRSAGWSPRISLSQGLAQSCDLYLQNSGRLRWARAISMASK